MALLHKSLDTYHRAVVECVINGEHLEDCDDDGYCNSCGFQDSLDDEQEGNHR